MPGDVLGFGEGGLQYENVNGGFIGRQLTLDGDLLAFVSCKHGRIGDDPYIVVVADKSFAVVADLSSDGDGLLGRIGRGLSLRYRRHCQQKG